MKLRTSALWISPSLFLTAPAWADTVRLEPLYTVSEGSIVDFDGKRALVKSGQKFVIVAEGGSETTVYEGAPSGYVGELHGRGAIFSDPDISHGVPAFLVWDGTQLRQHEGLTPKAEGKWIAFTRTVVLGPGGLGPVGTGYDVVLHDVESGQDVWTSPPAETPFPRKVHAVSASGSLVYLQYAQAPVGTFGWLADGELRRAYSSVGQGNTDGVNLVENGGRAAGSWSYLTGKNGMMSETLCTGSAIPWVCHAPVQNAGWTAFDAIPAVGANRTEQLYRRAPDGTREQLTDFAPPPSSYPSLLWAEAISPTGDVIALRTLGNGAGEADDTRTRYLLRGPGRVLELPANGAAVYQGGFYIIEGRTISRLIVEDTTVPDVDGGVSDAGSPPSDSGAASEGGDGATPVHDAGQASPPVLNDLDASAPTSDAGAIVTEPSENPAVDAGTEPSVVVDASSLGSVDASSLGSVDASSPPSGATPDAGLSPDASTAPVSRPDVSDGCSVAPLGSSQSGRAAGLLPWLVGLLGLSMRRAKRRALRRA